MLLERRFFECKGSTHKLSGKCTEKQRNIVWYMFSLHCGTKLYVAITTLRDTTPHNTYTVHRSTLPKRHKTKRDLCFIDPSTSRWVYIYYMSMQLKSQ